MSEHQKVMRRASLHAVSSGRKENGMTIVPTKSRVARSMKMAVLLLCLLIGVLASHSSLALASPKIGGVEKWAFRTGSFVSSSPAVVGGEVYVGSGDDNVYAITTR